MKFNVSRFGCAVASIWGLVVFLVGLANLLWPTYGVEFLKIIDSIYPGYHFGEWGLGGVIVGTLYAIIDAWVIGVIFALIYNKFTKKKRA
jgi:ABC-type phosphate transport system permease subunit